MDDQYAQQWARVVKDGATADGVKHVILAINRETAMRRANRADVMVACAQLLGQSIAPGGPEIAKELRQAVMAMIDGYAMEVAVNGN